MSIKYDIQLAIFALAIVVIGMLTYWKYRASKPRGTNDSREFFLAGGGLTWIYVAGSITITNLGTEQLVGMNGNQMLLLAWWELAAVVGLIILATVFVPIYYRHKCTTTTQLLEKRYDDGRIRTLISGLFMFGYIFVSMPSALYTGSLFMRTVFGIDIPLVVLGSGIALMGACYGLLGGLRAVAISETFSGVGLLTICMIIVFLALAAIGFDFSGIPQERLTLIGATDSPIPWHTLLTGMIFIQIFYWSTNQAITQRAMASPTVREAQKGVMAAAVIRLMIVPAIVVLPGVVAFKLYGDVNDAAFGNLVDGLLPPWLSGAFAAILVTSVATHFVAILNSAAALYVCDIHQKYINADAPVRRLNAAVSAVFVGVSILMIPVYSNAESIINLLQQLNGLLSMPILSAFIVGLLFRNVDVRAAMAGVLFGIALYAFFTFVHAPFGLHYIHLMFFTLLATITFALVLNRFVFGRKVELIRFPRSPAAVAEEPRPTS
jgi:solute:Na+ symporter, SSS family